MPNTWKDIILKDKGTAKKKLCLNNPVVKNVKFIVLTNSPVNSYLILADANAVKPTAQSYFRNLFETSEFNSKKIFSNS